MDTNFWIAVIGLIGVVVGSFLSILGSIVSEWFKNSKQQKIDKSRQEILIKMLSDKAFEWRNISTLFCSLSVVAKKKRKIT